MMYSKGDFVYVEENSHHYKCKVTDVNDNAIQVHFIRFNKKFDFWIQCDNPRITANAPVPEIIPSISCSQPASTATGLAVETRSSKRRRNSDSEVNLEDNPKNRKRSHVETQQDGTSTDQNHDQHDETVGAELDNVLQDNRAGQSALQQREGSLVPDASATPQTPPSNVCEPPQHISSPVEIPVAGVAHMDTPIDPIPAVLLCALCSCAVGPVVVKCVVCQDCFHAERMCVGVEEAVIRELVSGRGAISYTCCGCRGKTSQENGTTQVGMVTQMLGIMGAVVSEVRKLTNTPAAGEVAQIRQPTSAENFRRPDIQQPGQGRTISNEVRELYEREKRKCSLILRGPNIESKEAAASTFVRICEHLGVGEVNWMGVTRVNQGVWRGTVEDTQLRLNLLSEAPKLRRTSDFQQIYVQKDLTWWQRKELKEKRAASRLTGANAVQVQARAASPAQESGNSQSSEGPNQNSGERVITGGIFVRSGRSVQRGSSTSRSTTSGRNVNTGPQASNGLFPSHQLRRNFHRR